MKLLIFLSLALTMIFFCCCSHQVKKTSADTTGEKKVTSNPFFGEWNTPFGVPPFKSIENEHYLPAFEKAIEKHKAEIAAIVENSNEPTFENTIVALDSSGISLARVAKVFFGQLNANTNDELDRIAKKVSPMLTKHEDNILLDEELFARITAVHEKAAELDLNPEQATLIEEIYQDFVRGGANLNAEQKAELREINEKLSLLTLQFGQNILKENNRFVLVLKDKDDLAGLPERVVAAAARAAKEHGHEGAWVFTLHKPSLIPFLQYSEKRKLREKMLKGYINRGARGDELDNREIIKQIVTLRLRKAKLLGYESYADFALARRVAKTPSNVRQLLKKIWEPALRVAKREAARLQELIDESGGDFRLQPWDWWFYAEKLRRAEYELDENELRPYFELKNVRKGAFEVANKLYGIKFIEREDIPRYHPDVKTFEVQEADGSHIGIFYTDRFPRASKRGGAWCGTYRDPYKPGGEKVTPVVNNVCNFSMPTGDKPALLSFEEVTTLFHEFGHALHVLFNDTTYRTTGDAVRVDFVELPSQIMEKWAAEPEVLKMYARHYETGEPIPDALIEKIEKSRYFNQGFETVEYMAACFLDMDWHTLQKAGELDVDAFESRSLSAIGLIPEIVVRYKSPYFRHVFAGSYYAAGYYSYIWAAVLDADAFEAFLENGLFDRETARSFRENVLAPGGSEDQMLLYKRFRGSEPKIEPLLRYRGLLDEPQGAEKR